MEQYNQRFNTQMIHGIVCDAKHSEAIKRIHSQPQACGLNSEEKDEAAVAAFIENPIAYFGVAYINEMCGYGLIALQDIPDNTVVGTYSSEFIINKPHEPCSRSEEERRYDMHAGLNDKTLKITKENSNAKEILDARFRAYYYGDLTRFALHAPSAEKLAWLASHALLDFWIREKDILTANMTYDQVIIKNTPTNYYKTTAPIKKYSLAMINYGDGYWISARAPQTIVPGYSEPRGMPCLFWQGSTSINVLQFNLYQKKYIISKETVQLPKETNSSSPTESKEAPTPPRFSVIRKSNAIAPAPSKRKITPVQFTIRPITDITTMPSTSSNSGLFAVNRDTQKNNKEPKLSLCSSLSKPKSKASQQNRH